MKTPPASAPTQAAARATAMYVIPSRAGPAVDEVGVVAAVERVPAPHRRAASKPSSPVTVSLPSLWVSLVQQ
jgi:hypothetical protein